MVIYYDNTSSIDISERLVMHTKKKHIAIKYHFLRELVQDKYVILEYVNTKEQFLNIFTKLLPKDSFLYLRGKLGVIPLSNAHYSTYQWCINQDSLENYQVDAKKSLGKL